MRPSLILGLLFVFGTSSCNNDNGGLTIEQERLLLNETLENLVDISESVSCEDSDDWRFAPIGSKACGGPKGYIAYAVSIDTVQFFAKLEQYRNDENQFNAKWGIFSDCALVQSPSDVACENGKAVLVYPL